MIKSIRNNLLESNEESSQSGLLLAKYLTATDDNHTKVVELLKRVMASSANEAYKLAYTRWMQVIEEQKIPFFKAKLTGPLAVGLGNESVLETGLTTHFTYGMPIIPGSALKGLAKRGGAKLLAEKKINKDQFNALFGTTETASRLVFWDAWYDPMSVAGKPFHRDVVTVHHPKYYSHKDAWPTDFDDPIPIPFLVVRPGAEFLFAITAPIKEWGEYARNLMKWCLENLGAGAKTNAGYGWFSPPKEITSQPSVSGILWKGVIVQRNPGSGELSAVQDTNKSFARGKAAEELFKSLPEAAQVKLKGKKKSLSADIEVAPEGNSWKIQKILTKGE